MRVLKIILQLKLSLRFAIREKFESVLRDRMNMSVLSMSASTENTSALFGRGSSEFKRLSFLVLFLFRSKCQINKY